MPKISEIVSNGNERFDLCFQKCDAESAQRSRIRLTVIPLDGNFSSVRNNWSSRKSSANFLLQLIGSKRLFLITEKNVRQACLAKKC